jgi:thiol-disulfide isomerase/thioredoxin
MKKIIALIILVMTFNSCAQKVIINREVDSTEYGKMLLGPQALSQFQKEPYKAWYDENHNIYPVDKTALASLKKEKLNSYNITVFLGTWCGDSKRNFPRLIKILEETNYPKAKITIIGLNRKKQSPNGEEVKYNITHVPTIIVEKYGKEIGRITEEPETGFIEKDLLNIIKK